MRRGLSSQPPSSRRPSWPGRPAWRSTRPWGESFSCRLMCSRFLLATSARPRMARRLCGKLAGSSAADCSHVTACGRVIVAKRYTRAVLARRDRIAGAPPGSGDALLQALLEDLFRQVDADEHHLAGLLFPCRPLRPEIAAHQLVHALEDDLAVGSLHIEHALVAEQLRAIDLDDRAQEVFELGGVERLVGAKDE